MPFHPEIHLETAAFKTAIGTGTARRFLKNAVSLTFHDFKGDLTRSDFEEKRFPQFAETTTIQVAVGRKSSLKSIFFYAHNIVRHQPIR